MNYSFQVAKRESYSSCQDREIFYKVTSPNARFVVEEFCKKFLYPAEPTPKEWYMPRYEFTELEENVFQYKVTIPNTD